MPFPAEYKIILKNKEKFLVVFPNDPSIIWIQRPILDIFNLAKQFSKSQTIRKLLKRYRKDVLMIAYRDTAFLKKMGFLKYRNRNPWIRLHYSRNARPNSIRINLTNRCNLSCSYCYSSEFRNKNINLNHIDMDWHTAKKIIDWTFKVNKNNDSNYIVFCFFGGEPLLNMRLMRQAMKYIKTKSAKDKTKTINLSIVTNGTLIDRDVAGLLKEYNVLARITIHQKNGKLLYRETGEKIKILESKSSTSNIIVKYIIHNVQDIENIMDASKKLKKIAQTSSFDFNLKEKPYLPLLKKIKRISIQTMRDKVINHPFDCMDFDIETLISGKRVSDNCGAAQRLISFLPDGSIYPCSGPAATNLTGPLGNINDGGIDRKLYDVKIKKIKLKDRKNSACMKCWARSYCRGVCKYSYKAPSISEGKNLTCDVQRLSIENSMKIFSSLNDRNILNRLGRINYGFQNNNARQKIKQAKLLLHLRDLRNKRLRYAELVTPALYK